MRKKKITACLIAAGIVSSLGSAYPCLAEEKQQEQEMLQMVDAKEELVEGAKIAVVTRNSSGSFWKTVKAGMEAAIEDINTQYAFEKDQKISMTFEGPAGEAEVDGQINMIDAVLSENPDVLCLAANNMESCGAQLESAIENGIPVIMFDADLEIDLYTAFCGTDNQQVAQTAIEKLADAMDEQGEILIFAHESKSYTASRRVEGAEKAIKEYPDMQITQICYIDDMEDTEQSMREAIENHPNVKGIFCTNSVMANLYLKIQKDYSDRNLIFVGVDANEEQREAVKNGIELGVVAQQPYMIGYETICQAVCALGEGEVQHEILLDSVWMTKDNMDDPAYQQYLEQ